MPCDGVTVMEYQRSARNEAFEEIRELVSGLRTEGLDRLNLKAAGNLTFTVGVPVAGGILPVKIGIDMNARVTMITQGGTFEGGKQALERLIADALRDRGISLAGLKFETHTHGRTGPRLAYNMPQAGRL